MAANLSRPQCVNYTLRSSSIKMIWCKSVRSMSNWCQSGEVWYNATFWNINKSNCNWWGSKFHHSRNFLILFKCSDVVSQWHKIMMLHTDLWHWKIVSMAASLSGRTATRSQYQPSPRPGVVWPILILDKAPRSRQVISNISNWNEKKTWL